MPHKLIKFLQGVLIGILLVDMVFITYVMVMVLLNIDTPRKDASPIIVLKESEWDCAKHPLEVYAIEGCDDWVRRQ